jgi:hypothetical protein
VGGSLARIATWFWLPVWAIAANPAESRPAFRVGSSST